MVVASPLLGTCADLGVLRGPSPSAYAPWAEGTDGYGDDCRRDGHYAVRAG